MMKVQLSHILQNMFSAASLEELSAEKVQQLADEHPYFSTAQFLLAQKLKNEGQTQKAALYFHDPLWLQWIMKDEIKEEAPVKVEEPLPVQVESNQGNGHPVEEIPLDPYYTIDYFASQGIKAPTEVKTDDKLGRQLKSFTEWLKTMKRLPQTPIDLQTDAEEQQDIQQIAAGSLEQKEVLTETMADVLVKQDKPVEAIAIYEKLSLLDPSKRAYFAAKIENLKAK